MSLNLKSRGLLFRVCNLLSKVFTPGYSSCGRCGGCWNVVQPHNTQYSSQWGCFPLCEQCWQDLGTPEARLPYYESLVSRTWGHPGRWSAIREAVLRGK